MPSLDKPEPSRPDPKPVSVPWRLPSIHPDGRKFIVAALAVALFFWWVVDWDTVGWFVAAITAWIAAFFRDPVRTTPIGRGLILAPADGQVTMIATMPPPRELVGADGFSGDPVIRVSIHISVFDSHIIRTPLEGTVRKLVYLQGKFLNPELDKASQDNERQHMLVEGVDGTRVGLTQIAGMISRRIVPWVAAGDRVVAGQRIGIIRFGSRVDVFLPAGTGSAVLLGQRTVAGETLLARIGSSELIEGVAQ
jgi:phosphatidylserine decarboxylase